MGNIVLRIKTSQLKPHISGWKAQSNLYVNDKYTKGLKYGAFVCAETGTADGEVKPTLRYAGLTSATYTDIADTSVVLPAKAATGIVYESSARDIYASLIDLSNEAKLFPYGTRQQDPIVMLDEAVYEISDLDDVMKNTFFFRTTDKVLVAATNTTAVFDNTAKTIVMDGEITGIRIGEKIGTASATTYVTSCTYDNATGKTTIGLLAGLGNAIVETKLLATIFDPLYATNDQNGDVPFQLVPNGAKVGQVVSGIAAYIKLNA